MINLEKDVYSGRRLKSLLQERQIDSEREFARWRKRAGAPGFHLGRRIAVTTMLFPFLGIWILMFLSTLFALGINLAIYRIGDWVISLGNDRQKTIPRETMVLADQHLAASKTHYPLRLF